MNKATLYKGKKRVPRRTNRKNISLTNRDIEKIALLVESRKKEKWNSILSSIEVIFSSFFTNSVNVIITGSVIYPYLVQYNPYLIIISLYVALFIVLIRTIINKT
jgi:hypothetical protein